MPARSSGIIRAHVLLLLGLPIYVGLVWGLQRMLNLGQQPVGWLPALAVVLIPALIWMVHFYLQDRYEPEPTHYVLFVFLLGALVAAPLANWLIEGVFTVDRWTRTRYSAGDIAATFLVIAAGQEFFKYIVVRYTVYLSDEFDEPADGIVYSTAAGIGFATALNFKYISSGVMLTVGAVNVTIITLSHACFSGAVGYAMGQAKFAKKGQSQKILILGFLAAVFLNGSFQLLQSLARSGLDLSPWRGLALTGGFAAMVFGAVSWLMKRSLRPPEQPAASEG